MSSANVEFIQNASVEKVVSNPDPREIILDPHHTAFYIIPLCNFTSYKCVQKRCHSNYMKRKYFYKLTLKISIVYFPTKLCKISAYGVFVNNPPPTKSLKF